MSKGDGRGDLYSLDALITLYAFEPTLKDVYVEGRSDAGLLRWYLRERGLSATVRAVDDVVEVPASFVQQIPHDINSKGRALALAIKLAKDLGQAGGRATVVIDADWYLALGPQIIDRGCLIVTDLPAIESYCFQLRPLQKLLDTVLSPGVPYFAQDVVDALSGALVQLHSMRVVLHELGVRCARNPAALCKLAPEASSLNKAELLRRSHTAALPTEVRAELLAAADWYELAFEAFEQGGRGHDIAPMLIAFLGISGHLADPTTLEAAMRACLEIEDLIDWNLFRSLEARVTNAS